MEVNYFVSHLSNRSKKSNGSERTNSSSASSKSKLMEAKTRVASLKSKQLF